MARCTCPHPRGGKCTKIRTPEQRARHREVSNASYHRRHGRGQRETDTSSNSSDMQREINSLRFELQRVQAQYAAHATQTQSRIAELEALQSAMKYGSTGPDVQGLQQEVSRLNAELATARAQGATSTSPHGNTDASDLLQTIASGENIREIALTCVLRSDNGKSIDLFQKAADGYKDQSVRLSGYASTFSTDQFCYLTSPDTKNPKKIRGLLVRIVSVGREEYWGDLVTRCKNELVQGEGLLNEPAPGSLVDLVDW